MNNPFKSIKDEFRLRKAIALLLLIAAGAFLVLNSESLYYTTKYYNGINVSKNKDVYKTIEDEKATGEHLSYLDISDGTVISQEFTAEESKIRDIRLIFRNVNYYEAEGNIDITLEDSKGKVLGAASFTLDQIFNNKFLVSSFIGDSDVYNSSRIVQSKNQMPDASDGIVVKKGDRYTITIKAEGIKNADDFALCLVEQDPDEVSVLSADGKEVKDRIFFGFFTYSIFSYPVLVFLIFMLLMTALMVIFPWGALSSRINGKRADDRSATDIEVWIQRAVFLVTPAVCFWMNYKISGKKLSEIALLFFSKFGLYNLAIIIALLAVLYLITNSKRVSSALTTFLSAALMISCYFLILFRDIPLRACDFADIGTAADVASNYEFTINKSLMWVVTVAACMIALNISFKRTKGLKAKPRIALLVCTCALCAGIYLPLSDPDYSVEHNLQIKGFNQSGQYRVKGYVLGFTISFRDMHIQKPEGYSVEAAEEVAKAYQSDEAVNKARVSEESPNVIVIMNEAFSDLSVLGEFETNEDYMPFFRSLDEDAVKGMMHVSTFGGGTAKTEFEFLTGNTDAFLRSKTAYTNLIKDESPSLARTLKDQGYTGMIAFHPGKFDSYNRNNVYPYFGFDKYISIDDMEDPEKIREYVSDKECYDTIIEQFEAHEKEDADSPFFLFNVTIQNHGGFGYSTGIVDAGIEITDPELKLERPEQYLNLMKESDTAFEYLVEYFKAQDEPTAIVMFGDHQPGIGTEFYEEMADRADKEIPDIERTDRKYQVPFVIWTNYDIEEEEDVDISANMLSAYMLNKLGLRMTGYDKFLVDLHSRIPSLSSIAYYDSQGNAYEMDAENEEDLYMGDEILKYHYLQYNNMNKSSERIENFFTLAK